MSPTVGEIDGIVIKIKEAEHGSPHVHAWYQGSKVKIFINTLDVEGDRELPPKQMKKLREWIKKHRKYLLRKWKATVILDY
jgi:hypothetical protein